MRSLWPRQFWTQGIRKLGGHNCSHSLSLSWLSSTRCAWKRAGGPGGLRHQWPNWSQLSAKWGRGGELAVTVNMCGNGLSYLDNREPTHSRESKVSGRRWLGWKVVHSYQILAERRSRLGCWGGEVQTLGRQCECLRADGRGCRHDSIASIHRKGTFKIALATGWLGKRAYGVEAEDPTSVARLALRVRKLEWEFKPLQTGIALIRNGIWLGWERGAKKHLWKWDSAASDIRYINTHYALAIEEKLRWMGWRTLWFQQPEGTTSSNVVQPVGWRALKGCTYWVLGRRLLGCRGS